MKKFLMIFAMALCLVGCGNKPSDSEIKNQVVGNIMSDGGDDLFKVENFKKTNGFERDEKTYIADVEYDLVFKKGLREIAQQIRQESRGSLFGDMGAGMATMALKMEYGDFEAGHRVGKTDKVVFIKTEKGWRIDEN